MGGGILKRYHSWFALGQRLLDAGLVFGSLSLLVWLNNFPYSNDYQITAMFGGLLTWMVMGALDAYRPWRGASLSSEAKVVFEGWPLVVGILLVLAWLSKSTQFFSRIIIMEWFVLAPTAMLLAHFSGRLILRHLRKLGRNYRDAVVIGSGELAFNLIDRIQAADWMGVRIIGIFDDHEPAEGMSFSKGVPVIGRTEDAVSYVQAHAVDIVYIAMPMHMEEQIREVFAALQDTTASVYMVPDMLMFRLLDARMLEINGLPVFSLCETPIRGPLEVVKRLEDVILASLILTLISPLMLAIAIAVKLTSPGPVLFKQRRYGLNGEIVEVWKFRSMKVMEDGDVATQAVRHDPRVTSIGRLLRGSSLDELPQFINVLQGRLSIVGPRPHPINLNEQYRKLIRGYMWRHKVKPGITGWAQVNGWRGETDSLEKMERRIEHDIAYIQNWSLWLDLKIIAMTLWKGFRHPNAF